MRNEYTELYIADSYIYTHTIAYSVYDVYTRGTLNSATGQTRFRLNVFFSVQRVKVFGISLRTLISKPCDMVIQLMKGGEASLARMTGYR